ncbi:DNA-binding transcriptional regulator [Celeribacter sp. SCSIO 80788]|uniref:DNA-binding transcriptional regulator n=1 Tax=Celeribacter sp. SCSIO 80788 TaxID=3117013 RepID=UPI003DA49855
MASAAGQDGDTVRALTRGLAILHYINATGELRASDIAKALDIPRPTVYRLLTTLEEAGYVVFSATSNRVRVTRLAAALGDGYAKTSTLCQAVGPVFAAYGPQLVWPLDLSVYRDAAMVVQESTHARSPLSIDQAMLGLRMPVLHTSAGRAYLAFCPDEERRLILDHLRQMGDPEDMRLLDTGLFDRILTETRERGIAVRQGEGYRNHTASLAVPVRVEARVVGCISIIWIRSAMTLSDALNTYRTPLLEIAEKVALRLDA